MRKGKLIFLNPSCIYKLRKKKKPVCVELRNLGKTKLQSSLKWKKEKKKKPFNKNSYKPNWTQTYNT